ncbi:MAG: hypothetical protein ABH867_04285 [Patescibacteria group bacterium]|nr:hypothetical protein [Patescibacteria group bacterium]
MFRIIKKLLLLTIQLLSLVSILSLNMYTPTIEKKEATLSGSILLFGFIILHIVTVIGVISNRKWAMVLSIILIAIAALYYLGLVLGLAAIFSSG